MQLEKMRQGKERAVIAPRVCPICRAPVTRKKILGKSQEDSVALFCSNRSCYAQELEKIAHFVSRKAFDIEGLGEKVVAQLLNEGLIKDAADLFSLTQGDLLPLERFADKSAENLIAAIGQAKKISLARFIYALGIPQVGEETATRLAEHFSTLTKFQEADWEALTEVPDVGEKVAKEIINFLGQNQTQKFLTALLARGVVIEKAIKTNGRLSGKTFVFTGTLTELSREQAKDLVRRIGGLVSESVSQQTSYVVAGESPGSKLAKAQKLAVPVLTEREFLKLVK